MPVTWGPCRPCPGLIVLVAVFWIVHPPFGTLGNFAALLDQSAPTIFIAMGLVFVLLLGEIDLAAGTAAGACAAVMARLSVGYNAPWPVAIGAALVAGLVIGVITGWLCAKVRIPSFVVTLALFLAFQGVTLFVVNNFKGTKGNISINDKFIVNLVNGQMAPVLGWIMVVVLLAVYAAVKIYDSRGAHPRRPGRRADGGRRRSRQRCSADHLVVAVYLLNQNRSLNKSRCRRQHQRQAGAPVRPSARRRAVGRAARRWCSSRSGRSC